MHRILAIILLVSGAAHAAEIPVDVELVLAVDVSSSMNREEQQIQRDGYVAALTDPAVIASILYGGEGRIALTYMEWAGPDFQAVLVPWRLIDSAESAQRVAAELAAKPLAQRNQTSISMGLVFAANLFAGNGYISERRVIDISGDGPNTLGPPVTEARDAIVARNIVINGLPLMLQPAPTGYAERPDLGDYYRDCVIGGAGAFVLPAYSMEEIATAIRAKFVQEIAAVRAPILHFAASHPEEFTADCMIGQKEFYE
jgi:hypothetical protein